MRESLPEDGADEQYTRGRLDRASYRWGDTRQDADRIQVGRFLQHEFSVLGLLDGVEYVHRTDTGSRLGASFGYIPEVYDNLQTGNDLQASAFWRSAAEGSEPVTVGVALQNTWHDGEQDRNLLVGSFDAQPADDVSFSAETLVDFYGSEDTIKDDGVELTEARLYGRWRLSPISGVGLHATHVRWPETKGIEYGDLTPEQVADSRVDRVGVDGWRQLDEHLRVDGRLDVWQDEDESGQSGNVRAALRNVFWERGEVAADVFGTSGEFSDGRGLRLSAARAFETLGYGTLSWELSDYTTDTEDDSTDLLQQALRASLDTALGSGWTMSAYTEHRFGDSQDSLTL